MFIPFGLHITDEATEAELIERTEETWVDTVADDVTYETAIRTVVDILGATIISQHIIEVDVTVEEVNGHDWEAFPTYESTTHPADRYYGMWRFVPERIVDNRPVCDVCNIAQASNGACFCESSFIEKAFVSLTTCTCSTEALYCVVHAS